MSNPPENELPHFVWDSGAGAPLPRSREHQEGYCRGFMDAIRIIQQNRDHYRDILGLPKMSHAEVLRWIYSRPWCDSETHRTAPRRLDQPPGMPEVGPPAIESIDLYLIPSISDCQIGEDGQIVIKTFNWRDEL